MAASYYFLKIDGIKGESQDAKHKDEIEILVLCRILQRFS
jgi:type VI protein secretion system component Hcp